MSASALGVTETDPTSELTGSVDFSRLAASAATLSEVTTSTLVWVVRCGSCWPVENRLFPNRACAKPGSRNRSSAEAEYCLADRSDMAVATTTLSTTTTTTSSFRRQRTDSNSNGETVGAEAVSDAGSRSGRAMSPRSLISPYPQDEWQTLGSERLQSESWTTPLRARPQGRAGVQDEALLCIQVGAYPELLRALVGASHARGCLLGFLQCPGKRRRRRTCVPGLEQQRVLLAVHALADPADVGGDERHAGQGALDRDKRKRLPPSTREDRRGAGC